MAHVLVLPFHTQGHINPMLQFAKELASKGLRVTLVTTSYITNSIKSQISTKISIASISDGYDEGGPKSAPNFQTYYQSLEVVGSRTLLELIEKQNQSTETFTCIVFDTLMAWGDKVAQSIGLPSVAFSTQSCAVSAISYHLNRDSLDIPEAGASVNMFGLPPMERSDFPSIALKSRSCPAVIQFALNQLDSNKTSWVLLNSFDKLETEPIESFKNYFHPKAIGPCVPFLSTANVNNSYGMSLLEPEDDTCMKWLNSKPPNSVVYVSFGSFASLQDKQMDELAAGLKDIGKYFLWVVREEEQKKLPNNFLENLGEKGLVVAWSPQLKVLADEAIGCFLTHCGWNSTLEAICFGVLMVAMPLWFDQPTNAKFIVDEWNVGVRTKASEEGLVVRDEIMRCVNEIMCGKKGGEIKKNMKKWKELAQEAANNGGSSDKNLNEFVAYVNGIAEKIHKLDYAKTS